ncbi:MAG: S8 family serine peptidase [Bacteroidota bacterium]
MKLTSLILLLSGFWGCSLYAQTYYIGDHNDSIALNKDVRMLSIFVEDEEWANDVFQASVFSGAEILPTLLPAKHFTVLLPTGEEDESIISLLASIVDDTSQVESAHFGYRTDDGMGLYLSHRVVFLENNSFDSTVLKGLLASYPSAQLGQTGEGISFISLDNPDRTLPLSIAMSNTQMFHWVQPDFYAQPELLNDPFYGDQYYLNNTGQLVDGFACTPDIDIDAPEAWALMGANTHITVAVIDNGVEAHLDLEDTMGISRVLPGYAPPATGIGTGAPNFSNEMHGQACAGIIGALHGNNRGIRGIAQHVDILPVYFPFIVSPTVVSSVADGVMWSWRNGADVVNNAYGYPSCANNIFPVLRDAIDSAVIRGRGGLGTVMVYAAGNDTSCVRYPGNLPTTIACGAVDKNGTISNYSNTGPEIDVVAPSATTNLLADIRVTDRMGANGINMSGNPDLTDIDFSRYFGGTSSATSQVAGVSALILTEGPNLTADSVRGILRTTARDLGPAGFDNQYGYGLLNAYQAVQVAMDTTLPVLWMEVSVKLVEAKVQLAWRAVQSEGVDYQVYRDGKKIAQVPFSSSEQYQFVDLEAPAGWVRYKIAWQGINGELDFSDEVEIFVPTIEKIGIRSTDLGFELYGRSRLEGRYDLYLYDMMGKEVIRERIDLKETSFNKEIQLPQLSHQVYLLNLVGPNGQRSSLKWLP